MPRWARGSQNVACKILSPKGLGVKILKTKHLETPFRPPVDSATASPLRSMAETTKPAQGQMSHVRLRDCEYLFTGSLTHHGVTEIQRRAKCKNLFLLGASG